MSGARAGRLVAGATLLVLVASGCTPPADPPPPSPSSSSVAPTPTENAQEREQRLAYEAAEKSYREFRAEYNRVLRAGGSAKPTPLMKNNAAGPYLKETAEVSEAFKGLDYHQVGSETIKFIRRNGYSEKSVALKTCEDSTKADIFNAKGKTIGKGEIRLLDLEVKLIDSAWKVWTGSSTRVTSCE